MPPPMLALQRRIVTDDIRRLHLHLILISAALVAVLAAGLLLGWDVVTRGRATWPQIYPYTVAGAAALVAAMALLRTRSRAGRIAGLALAGITVLLGAGVDLAVSAGLLPSADPVTNSPLAWFTPLPAAAATVGAISVALIPWSHPVVARVRFWAAAAAGAVSLFVVLAFVYVSEKLILGMGATGTSLPTAVIGITILGASMSARPDLPPLASLDRRFDRGLLRRILPMLIVAPFVPALVHGIVSTIEPDPASADAIAQFVTVLILVAVIVVMGGGQSKARRELDLQRQRVWDAFAHAPAGMAVVSIDGRIATANDALARLTGRVADQLVGSQAADLLADSDRARVAESLAELGAGRAGFRRDVRFQTPSGRIAWVDLGISPVRDSGGKVLYLILQCTDLTDRKDLERVLAEQAVRDPLTGLLNREGLTQQVGTLRRIAGSDRDVIVVFADVDNLKNVNDTAGHAAGDDLLREVARRLGTCTRGEDIVARFGGDEFVVVTTVPASAPGAADAVIERLRGELAGTVQVGALRIPLSVSLGASTLQRMSDTATAIARADSAMYADKQQRRRASDT